ncbi:MAG: arylformamidase [Thermodesulfobacteriota bacterium]|nr:arylformamidase [Thermodesulfobacteriota bacterium]
MPIYDATLPLEEGMVAFPGDPVFGLERVLKTSSGDAFNLSLLNICTHTGTHVDPPAHYIEGGASVDELPLDALIGPGLVMGLPGVRRVDANTLRKGDLQGRTRVLFKTDNSSRLRSRTFCEDFVHLTEDGALYLVEAGVRLVGIDYVSIERFGNIGAPVHHILLSAGVVIVETLDLQHVPVGLCDVYCLPLRIRCGDGAPARVLVRTEN